MIRSLYLWVRDLRWNRDRCRRIDEIRRNDPFTAMGIVDWLSGMNSQLAEIRALPEAWSLGDEPARA
jgi:hypothetical protein